MLVVEAVDEAKSCIGGCWDGCGGAGDEDAADGQPEKERKKTRRSSSLRERER